MLLGVASRADIARATGLARSTVSSVIHDLVSEGTLVKAKAAPEAYAARAGRPANAWYTIPRELGYVVGVDIGHREIRAGLADLSTHAELPDEWELFEGPGELGNTDQHPEETLATAARQVCELVEANVPSGSIVGIGMSMAAPIDHDGRIHSGREFPKWHAFKDVARELKQRLPDWADPIPVHAGNDATLGMLAEYMRGSARGRTNAVYLRVSQGVGAGLLLGSRIHRGARGFAGEFGHVPVADTGPHCPRCGTSCVEANASIPSLIAQLGSTYDRPDGTRLDGDGLIALAADGDPGAMNVLRGAGDTIARGLGGVCDLLNPELVVVGGQLSASNVLVEAIRSGLPGYTFEPTADVEVVRSELGTRAQMFGAIALALHHVPPARQLAATSAPDPGNRSNRRRQYSPQPDWPRQLRGRETPQPKADFQPPAPLDSPERSESR